MDYLVESSQQQATSSQRQVFTVSQLNRKVKGLLEIHLPLIWIEGEISNFTCPRSGHWYFTLKDEQAQVRAAMFKGRNQSVKTRPKEGDKVLIRARVSLYEGRGDYQLIAEHMETAGLGLLQQQFEELKLKLHQQGLFNEAHKKPFPRIPKHIAVVTSPSGAAIQDVLSVLARRFPALQVSIIPASVQGELAPQELIRGLTTADAANMFDTIVLCRGGGSIEDLWAFNNEALAHAIFAAKTPVISAVGHEVDFTIADFVADYRAPTPSAAAEYISPDQDELQKLYDDYSEALTRAIGQKINNARQRVEFLRAQLKHPGDKLTRWAQQLNQLDIRLNQAGEKQLQKSQARFEQLQQRFLRYAPQHQITAAQQKIESMQSRLEATIKIKLELAQQRLAKNAEALHIVSPLATLSRGYAIVKDEQGNIVRSKKTLKKGDNIQVAVAEGTFEAEVKNTSL